MSSPGRSEFFSSLLRLEDSKAHIRDEPRRPQEAVTGDLVGKPSAHFYERMARNLGRPEKVLNEFAVRSTRWLSLLGALLHARDPPDVPMDRRGAVLSATAVRVPRP